MCGKPEYLASEWEDVGMDIPNLCIIGQKLRYKHEHEITTMNNKSIESDTKINDNPMIIPHYVLGYKNMLSTSLTENTVIDENNHELIWILASDIKVDNIDNTLDNDNNILDIENYDNQIELPLTEYIDYMVLFPIRL